MTFAERMKEAARELTRAGHTVVLPEPVDTIHVTGNSDDAADRKAKYDLIRRHWDNIRKAEAILVLNYDKDGVAGYVGGNTFLEMGFAHVLRKPIYVLRPLPKLSYTAEMKAMSPIILMDRLTLP